MLTWMCMFEVPHESETLKVLFSKLRAGAIKMIFMRLDSLKNITGQIFAWTIILIGLPTW